MVNTIGKAREQAVSPDRQFLIEKEIKKRIYERIEIDVFP